MICKDYCRKAGEMNWLLTTDTASSELTEAIKQKIEALHAQCRGGTWCDCQHKLGRHLSFNGS